MNQIQYASLFNQRWHTKTPILVYWVLLLRTFVFILKCDNFRYYLTCDLDQSYFILSVYGLRNEAVRSLNTSECLCYHKWKFALCNSFYRSDGSKLIVLRCCYIIA
jgi:hypothetical protein